MKQHLCFLLLANLTIAQAQGTFSDWFTKPSLSIPVVLIITGLTGACGYFYGCYQTQNREIKDIKKKLDQMPTSESLKNDLITSIQTQLGTLKPKNVLIPKHLKTTISTLDTNITEIKKEIDKVSNTLEDIIEALNNNGIDVFQNPELLNPDNEEER